MDVTTQSGAPELDRLVGRNLRTARASAGLSQSDVAEAMAAGGFPSWKKVTVADVERGARRVSLDELAGLADATETRVDRLLAADAELTEAAERRAKVLTGKARPKAPDGLEDVNLARSQERLIAYIIAELGIDEARFAEASRALYGGSGVMLQRERRVFAGEIPSVEGQNHELRARRGHATRAIIAEMREWLDAQKSGNRGTRGKR